MAERVVRYLIVEDEPDMAALIAMLFDRNAHPDETIECCGTVDTIDAALSDVFGDDLDVIILDEALPGGRSGLDGAALLKARWPNARIILYSARDLAAEALLVPAIDSFLLKDRYAELLPESRRLLLRSPSAAIPDR